MLAIDYLNSLMDKQDRDSSNLVALCLLNLNGEQIQGHTEHQVSVYQIMNRAGLLKKVQNGYLSNPYNSIYLLTGLGKHVRILFNQDLKKLKQNSKRINPTAEDNYYKLEITSTS